MKGPTDINDLLSGLKTMSVNLPAEAPTKKPEPTTAKNSTTPSAKTPRKQKSDRNTVSLDI
jgi:hypothetical protein